MRKKLICMSEKHPSTLRKRCICIDNVFNLVTKEKYWHKPTYESLKESLLEMKYLIQMLQEYDELYDNLTNDDELCYENSKFNNSYKIVMPKIGCGLDRLSWDKVEVMIKEIFEDLDIEIIVCYL